MSRAQWAMVLLVGLGLGSVLGGCASEPVGDDGGKDPGTEAPFAFEDPIAGKADGPQAVLPAAQLQQLDARLRDAIALAEARVAALSADLAKLERDLPGKQAEIDALVARIDQRRREVQADYDRQRNNALIFAFFGVPAGFYISLAQAFDSDSALRQLEADRASAVREQSDMRARQADYTTRRDGLRTRLATLVEAKRALVALLASQRTPRPAPAGLAAIDWAEVDRLAFRVDILARVLGNTRSQAALLDEMVTLAQGQSDALDRAVRALRQLAADADRAAAESRTDALTLLKILLSGDPTAAARSFLEDRLAARARAALSTLGWGAGPFVDILMGGDPDAVLHDALLARLETAARPGTPAPALRTLRVTGAGGRIQDFTTLTSTARVSASGVARRVHVKIDLRHSFRGDLVLTLVHGGQRAILHQHEGGAADDLHIDTDVSAFASIVADGDWTLEVRDDAKADEGSLDGFALGLEVE